MNLRRNHDSEDLADADGLTAQMLEWARERTAHGRTDPGWQAQPLQAGTPKARANVVVVALHEGSSDWGEAHLFEDIHTAKQFVQSLLEGGIDEHRLSVFNTTPIAMQVSYRPVVDLKRSDEEGNVVGEAKPADSR